MSKISSLVKAAGVMSVLFGAMTAQAGGGPVTREGFQAHRDYGRAMDAGQMRANLARAQLNQVEAHIAARTKAGKYVSSADRMMLEEAKAQYTGAQRALGQVRDAGIKPFLPARIVVTAPEQPSREEMYKAERYGAYDDRRMASLPVAGASKPFTSTPRTKVELDMTDALHKLTMASTSLGDDALEHIFPGNFEVGSQGGRPVTITGYRQRLDYLLEQLGSLEQALTSSDDRPKTLAAFQTKNGAWLGRYNDAIAARQLMFDRNAARMKDKSLKALSESDALGEIAKKPASTRTAALERWFRAIGGKPASGLKLLGENEGR